MRYARDKDGPPGPASICAGVIPRGEVGLFFAQMGLTSGVFDSAMFSAVALEAIEDLVTEA
jgi:hypothetical protein